MNSVMEFMGKDHDRLDGIFNVFRKVRSQGDAKSAGKAGELFSEFKAGLERHIVWEEEILFPAFEERTGMRDSGPTAVMRMEHEEIKGYLEGILEKVKKGDMKTEKAEASLLDILTAHNHKEENILYPWIDRSLNQAQLQELFDRINGKSATRA